MENNVQVTTDADTIELGQITPSEERFFGAVASDHGIDANDDIEIADQTSPRLFKGQTEAGRRFVRFWEAGRDGRRRLTMWVERELTTPVVDPEQAVSTVSSYSYAPLRDGGVGRQMKQRLQGPRKRKRSR